MIYEQSDCESCGTLNIAMYPFIPDSAEDNFDSLTHGLESKFAELYPNYNIKLDFSKVADIYDPITICNWLENNTFDIVAVDAILLGSILDNCKLGPWLNQNTEDWHQASLVSSTYNNQIYGIPHYLCSLFVFSLNEKIQQTNSIDELTKLLDSFNTPSPNMIHSGFIDSYVISSFYSIAQNQFNSNILSGQAVSSNYDEQSLSAIKTIFQQCEEINSDGSKTNHCLTFDQKPQISRFINGQADSMVGYFETLHSIASNNKEQTNIYFTTLNLSSQEAKPVIFTDIFIKSPNCKNDCESIANKFAEFITKPEILEYIIMSKDVDNNAAHPRYVIPATKSALEQTEVKNDPYYKQVSPLIKNAMPIPNSGIPERRESLAAVILPNLN